MKNEREIIALAKQCVKMGQSGKKRPEILWLQNVYERFYREAGLDGKADADGLIYKKIYGCIPDKPSDTLKIRYWRTGYHTPINREQCLAFGKALELDEKEMTCLIQQYYDRSDQIFDESSVNDPEYIRRKACMDGYIKEYLLNIHPRRLRHMKITKSSMQHYLRHLYYSDALQYVCSVQSEKAAEEQEHIMSVNYGSELSRNLRLFGEIPRKTMIRNILLLGMPYINREILNERLGCLGYLPLEENHTMVGGEYLDWLLIQLLELYETSCQGEKPEVCVRWFQSGCRLLDQYFLEHNENNLRFMYFKALKT